MAICMTVNFLFPEVSTQREVSQTLLARIEACNGDAREMREKIIEKRFAFEKIPHISLSCKRVLVHFQGYKNYLFRRKHFCFVVMNMWRLEDSRGVNRDIFSNFSLFSMYYTSYRLVSLD